MYNEIAANKRKTVFIMAMFMVFAGVVGFLVSYLFLDGGWVSTAMVLVFAAVYALFSYYNAGKMAVAMNNAQQVDAKSEPRLYRTVENIAITTGMPMPKVYVIEDPALNAFATGRNPDNAIVAATRGLLNRLEDDELEGVMAHEMGHVQNYDIRVSMIAFALVAVIAMFSDIFTRALFWGGGNDRNRGSGPMVLIGIILLVISPFVAQALRLAVSRKREYLADATGALTTRYPEGLASALEKIATYGSATRKQNTATAHLFIANPLRSKSLAGLFSTHPPVEERIARLRNMDLN